MAKVLITGGAGFIGSHLAEGLLSSGHEVVILDNLDPYYDVRVKKRNLGILSGYSSCRFIQGDILDMDLLRGIINDGVKYIYHQAAQPGVRISVEDPLKPNEVNGKGTLNVLEVARRSDIIRVINASSSSVYGIVKYLPFDEEHPTEPISPYGVSKLLAEHYCRVYYNLYGLPTVNLRYFTVYGPRMRPDLAIPIFSRALIAGKSPEIFGDGEQTRDFTYIEDIVKANLNLLKTSSADGEILNIGSGRRVTVNVLFENLRKLLGSTVEPVHVEEMKGDAKHTLSKIDKARDLIQYDPSTTIEDGLKKFLEWYKKNPDFYD